MAVYGQGIDQTFIASVDMSAYQYRLVKAGSVQGEITLATLGALCLGVLQNDPRATEEATVRVLGSTKVYANSGTALTYGGLIKSGSDGMAWGYGTMTASTYSAGIALEALSSGSGVYVEMLLIPTGAFYSG